MGAGLSKIPKTFKKVRLNLRIMSKLVINGEGYGMWGSGKKRSRLGKWLDQRGLNQEDLVKEAKVSRNTISKACYDDDYVPSPTVMKKILHALRQIDPGVNVNKFWDI
jgi:DNA-binding XRE family transcriptional regulator